MYVAAIESYPTVRKELFDAGCARGLPDASVFVCTADGGNRLRSCTPPLKNCDDANPCTTDSCDTGTGCINANVADKTNCNSTGVRITGICKPGVCGDGVLIASLGEQCDDVIAIRGPQGTLDDEVDEALGDKSDGADDAVWLDLAAPAR